MPSVPTPWVTPKKPDPTTPGQEAGDDRAGDSDDEGMGGFLEFVKFVGSVAASVLLTGWILEKSKTSFKPGGKVWLVFLTRWTGA
eukprot:1188152-Prorocentrum_minimum.AAC.1